MDVFEGGLARTDQFGPSGKGERPRLFTATATSSCPFSAYISAAATIKDITSYLGGTFSMRPNTKAASSDTIARALKELAQDNVIYRSDSGRHTLSTRRKN